MKVTDKSYLIKTYRNYRLKKETPNIIRTMFVERKGNFLDLLNKHGKDNVEAQLYLGHIVRKFDGNWELTEAGKEDSYKTNSFSIHKKYYIWLLS